MTPDDRLKLANQIEKLDDLVTHTESLITKTEFPDMFLRWLDFKAMLLHGISTRREVLERNGKKCPICGEEIEEI